MKMSKRTRTVVLWAIAIGLLIGMVISFTPSMGLFQNQTAQLGTPQILVNDQPIREAEVLTAKQGTLFNAVTEGPVADDLERLLVDELVRQKLITQAASSINVSGAEVRQAVEDFRASRGVSGRGNDRNYVAMINASGFTDQTFRDYLRDQLRLSAWEESLVKDVAVSDAEVEAFYLSHTSSYQSEERILARQMVVADRETAEDLRAQVADGASFAALAAEASLELADRQGALGAQAGETEPRPVGRAALPTAVANAAFALRGAGLTEVVETPAGFQIVQVEEYVPSSPLPFEEVRATVAEDALTAKKQGVVEAEIERLRAAAKVSFPDTSLLTFENPAVAKVGDTEITEVQLDRATYTNSQIQQALSPQTADLIVGLFKPAVLSQLIDTELAYQGASRLDLPLVGSKAGIAQAALDYVSRDATVTEDEVESYYNSNIAAFTLDAEADVTQVDFTDLEAAAGFRAAVLDGTSLAEAASDNGGTVTEHGRVLPNTLSTELNTALFSTSAFAALPGGELEVSDVIVVSTPIESEPAADEEPATDEEAATDEVATEAGEPQDPAAVDTAPTEVETFVVLVADRTPARERPLADVHAQVSATVLASNRQSLRSEWLAGLRDEIQVTEFSLPDLAPETTLPTDPLPDLDLELAAPEDAAAGEDNVEQPADELPVEEAPADSSDD
ncbi:MAG TPA: peptidyl-prolyl cis-trans isomerase [Trueperaceae bacterium]|nr:peptidyl-prolyl cis-trans isomerase [Trueperaceae bacterium]